MRLFSLPVPLGSPPCPGYRRPAPRGPAAYRSSVRLLGLWLLSLRLLDLSLWLVALLLLEIIGVRLLLAVELACFFFRCHVLTAPRSPRSTSGRPGSAGGRPGGAGGRP